MRFLAGFLNLSAAAAVAAVVPQRVEPGAGAGRRVPPGRLQQALPQRHRQRRGRDRAAVQRHRRVHQRGAGPGGRGAGGRAHVVPGRVRRGGGGRGGHHPLPLPRLHQDARAARGEDARGWSSRAAAGADEPRRLSAAGGSG